VESTVYRRSSDGKIVGTPEAKPVIEIPVEPVFAVTTYRAGDIGQSQAQPKIVADTPQPVVPVKREASQPTPVAVKPSPKLPAVKLPKFSFGKSKSRFPRPVRYIRNIVLAYLGFYVVLGFHAAASLDKIGKDEGSQRTDTIMVIHIDDSGKPTLVSLPRDSYITIPAHIALDGSSVEDRKNKINTAYDKGGAPLLVETVERNTGLHIDHYMEVGFKGIRDITDAVGGVNMCVPADVTDENSGLNLLAGCQELDGKNALAYVRMRYADPKGDLGRIERQQQFLSSVMKKVATPAVLLNPISMWKLVDAGTGSVNVGDGDSVMDISSLARAMRALSNGNGTLTTVPVSETDANTAAGSSVIWDDAAARELFVSLGAN